MRELLTYTPDFEEYIRQGEPGKKERAQIWRTAIGLQQVDGLCISDYMKELVRRNIEGELSMAEVRKLIDEHYKGIRPKRKPRNDYYGYVRCSKEFTTSFEEHIQRHKANVGINSADVGKSTLKSTLKGTLQSATQSAIQSANLEDDVLSKCKNCTLKELAVLRVIQQNPSATQKQIAEQIRKSERTVKTITVSLGKKGLIVRRKGKRDGHWEVLPPQAPPQV